MTHIELLAPAKNLESGIAAIQSGADAVYMGAVKFGARSAAGNSLDDIKALVQYAHFFNVKVFITINTILYDNELLEARNLCHEIYQAGADAIIIQDLGLLQLDLPPIAIHSSTQMHNHTPEKVKFLEDTGFNRVILARELSIDQIKEIRRNSSVELEAFIHGALCVSYSGRCYLSHSIGSRSANRGECAQPCRNKYDLGDEQGNVILKDKHLLSLHDLNLSASIGPMIDAGISSFKIEGRLKDIDYVKNVTSYYRRLIDIELEKREGYVRSSSGKVTTSFTPDPTRSFNRGFTTYFINGRSSKVANHSSPKATGAVIGTVATTGQGWITLKTTESMQNGDGLCWLDSEGTLVGTRVNIVKDGKIFVGDTSGLKPGVTIMRNFDKSFNDTITRDDACKRTIEISLILEETEGGFTLHGIDENGIESFVSIQIEKIPARTVDVGNQKIIEQLKKSGQTLFTVSSVDVNINGDWFFQSSLINQLRRDLLDKASENRIQAYKREDGKLISTNHPYPKDTLTSTENISNRDALEFYRLHQFAEAGLSPETEGYKGDEALMTTKMCIKFELGKCPTYHGNDPSFPKTVYLSTRNKRFRLSFDCKACVMRLYSDDAK